jgi:hypothetical protein
MEQDGPISYGERLHFHKADPCKEQESVKMDGGSNRRIERRNL